MTTRSLAAAAILLASTGLACGRKEQVVPAAPAPTTGGDVQASPSTQPRSATTPYPTPGGTPALGSVTFGKSVNADHSPKETASSFAPTDTVIVSYYIADGRPETVVKVRWIAPNGTVLNEASSALGKPGDGWGEFRVSRKPGLDPGSYLAELWIDDQKAGEGGFTVEGGAEITPTP